MKGSSRVRCLLPLTVLACLGAAGCGTVPARDEGGVVPSAIQGRVTRRDAGTPVKGAHVYAYGDYSKNLIGVADYVSRGSDADGNFTLDLPPGEYYVVARKRNSGSNYGPIVTGDLYDHRFESKPVKVKAGSVVTMDFALAELAEPLFFQAFSEDQRRTDVGLKGRILNEGGQPVQGAFATAYRDKDMKRLPDFASTLTDDDGNFTLYLPEGGKWFVGARSHARGVPVPGELIGRYDLSEDHSVQVPEKGFLEGIDVILRPFASQPPEGYVPY